MKGPFDAEEQQEEEEGVHAELDGHGTLATEPFDDHRGQDESRELRERGGQLNWGRGKKGLRGLKGSKKCRNPKV